MVVLQNHASSKKNAINCERQVMSNSGYELELEIFINLITDNVGDKETLTCEYKLVTVFF